MEWPVAMLVMVATPASKLTVHTRLSALSSVVSNVLYPVLAQAFFPCAVSMVLATLYGSEFKGIGSVAFCKKWLLRRQGRLVELM